MVQMTLLKDDMASLMHVYAIKRFGCTCSFFDVKIIEAIKMDPTIERTDINIINKFTNVKI